MISVILASGNLHKAKEFSELFDSSIVNVTSAIEKIEVEETGTTFLENSFQKAKSYYDFYKTPILSDDSGLVVASLPDKLGVYSARYGGNDLDDKQRAMLLLKEIEGKNKDAYFICQLCFYLNPSEIFYFEGRLEGHISNDFLGDQGFGYDPVFIPNKGTMSKTLAEVPKWKRENSHRARATSAAQFFFKKRNCQKR